MISFIPSYVIVFSNPDDPSRVSVMYPTGELPVEELINRHIDTTKPYKIMEAVELPNNDNDFFEAWQLLNDVVSVNIEKAKDIHRNSLRAERNKQLADLDIQYMRSIEMGDSEKQQEVAVLKQKLRDIPAHPSIENAQTTEELRTLTIDVLLAI